MRRLWRTIESVDPLTWLGVPPACVAMVQCVLGAGGHAKVFEVELGGERMALKALSMEDSSCMVELRAVRVPCTSFDLQCVRVWWPQ